MRPLQATLRPAPMARKTPEETAAGRERREALARAGFTYAEDGGTVTAPATPAAPEPDPDQNHLLIEGTLAGRELAVGMPSGHTWRYTVNGPGSAGGRWTTVLVYIDMRFPRAAAVFRPSADGLHPFLSTACRFGVERSVA